MQYIQPLPILPPSLNISLTSTHDPYPFPYHSYIFPTHHPRLIVRQILLIATPPPKEADAILDGVDGVADEGEDDEEADYYYRDDDVAFDHFWGF